MISMMRFNQDLRGIDKTTIYHLPKINQIKFQTVLLHFASSDCMSIRCFLRYVYTLCPWHKTVILWQIFDEI